MLFLKSLLLERNCFVGEAASVLATGLNAAVSDLAEIVGQRCRGALLLLLRRLVLDLDAHNLC